MIILGIALFQETYMGIYEMGKDGFIGLAGARTYGGMILWIDLIGMSSHQEWG